MFIHWTLCCLRGILPILDVSVLSRYEALTYLLDENGVVVHSGNGLTDFCFMFAMRSRLHCHHGLICVAIAVYMRLSDWDEGVPLV